MLQAASRHAGRLAAKIQRQPIHAEMPPPMLGPTAIATPETTPSPPNTRVREAACG